MAKSLRLWWLAALVLVVGTAFGERGVKEVWRDARGVADLRELVEVRRQEIARLEDEIALLERDERTIEGVAREDLSMVRPDEIVLILRDAHLARTPSLDRSSAK